MIDKHQTIFEQVEAGSLEPGSIFLWNGHMYVFRGNDQADRIASHWTNNPGDRWIADNKALLSQDFNPYCKVWWMRHDLENP